MLTAPIETFQPLNTHQNKISHVLSSSLPPFLPAGELIGAAHEIRMITLGESQQLPSGEYAFVDYYCTDPSCDCRKTIIKIHHNDQHVSTVNYGWEKPA